MKKDIVNKLLWRIKKRWFPRSGPRAYLMKENPRLAAFNIGEHSYGEPKILFTGNGASLRIGKYVSIADEVVIMMGGEHRIDWISTYPFNEYFEEWSHIDGHPATKGDVAIGNNVWIGREAMILSGVTIGNGAVIGARAVVTKDVAPYSVVAGNPMRHIRFRFDADSIVELQRIAWWDWPDQTVRAATPFLLSGDISGLVNFYEQHVKS